MSQKTCKNCDEFYWGNCHGETNYEGCEDWAQTEEDSLRAELAAKDARIKELEAVIGKITAKCSLTDLQMVETELILKAAEVLRKSQSEAE